MLEYGLNGTTLLVPKELSKVIKKRGAGDTLDTKRLTEVLKLYEITHVLQRKRNIKVANTNMIFYCVIALIFGFFTNFKMFIHPIDNIYMSLIFILASAIYLIYKVILRHLYNIENKDNIKELSSNIEELRDKYGEGDDNISYKDWRNGMKNAVKSEIMEKMYNAPVFLTVKFEEEIIDEIVNDLFVHQYTKKEKL